MKTIRPVKSPQGKTNKTPLYGFNFSNMNQLLRGPNLTGIFQDRTDKASEKQASNKNIIKLLTPTKNKAHSRVSRLDYLVKLPPKI